LEHVRSSGKRLLLLLLLQRRSILVVLNVASSRPVYAVVCFIGPPLYDVKNADRWPFLTAAARVFSTLLTRLPACRVHARDNPHFPRLLLLVAVQKPDAGVDGNNTQLMLLMSLIGCA